MRLQMDFIDNKQLIVLTLQNESDPIQALLGLGQSSPICLQINLSNQTDHNSLFLFKVNYLSKNLPVASTASDRLSMDSNLNESQESKMGGHDLLCVLYWV